jgi:uncharacterized peroxidase-related enzyme
MAWIKVIEENYATGKIKEIYAEITKKRGKLSNIMKAQSLKPESMKAHMEMYLSIMFEKSNIPRSDRELIAVVVSSLNQCEYCIRHHEEALQYYWKDNEKLNGLIDDFQTAELPEKTKSMLQYVSKLTLSPQDVKKEDIDKLRNFGFNDRGILDINLITSYFNFVNRIALGLGVEFSENEIKGYKY